MLGGSDALISNDIFALKEELVTSEAALPTRLASRIKMIKLTIFAYYFVIKKNQDYKP